MLHDFLILSNKKQPARLVTPNLAVALGLALAAASLDSQLSIAWETPSSAEVADLSHGFIPDTE